jgi:hypothetical protein
MELAVKLSLPFLLAQTPSPAESATESATASVTETVGDAAQGTVGIFTDLWSGISESMGPQLGEFLPKLIGAIVLLVVGYIIARIIGWIIAKVINNTGIGDKLGPYLGSTDGTRTNDVGSGFGTGAFWIVMMFVAIACLKALGLDSVSEPLNDLLTKFFAFIPQLIGAAAVGAVAFLIATIAKIGVHKGLTIGDVDNRLKLAPGTLSNSLPLAAFSFLMLLALPAIFGALKMKELSEPVQSMVDQILGFLPSLLSASIILAIFYLIAKLSSNLVSSLLGGTGFNKIPQHLGLLSDTSTMKAQPSELAGKASMGVILLMGISQAVKMLKLDVVSNVFNEVFEFAVPVVIGVVILGVGLWLANMARTAVQASKDGTESAGNMVFMGVMVLTGIIALKRMGLAGELVDLGFGLALGGVALALGLAFGLGGRNAAAQYLEDRMKR